MTTYKEIDIDDDNQEVRITIDKQEIVMSFADMEFMADFFRKAMKDRKKGR